TSGENFFGFDSLVMAPLSQELEPPANLGRFTVNFDCSRVYGVVSIFLFGCLNCKALAANCFLTIALQPLERIVRRRAVHRERVQFARVGAHPFFSYTSPLGGLSVPEALRPDNADFRKALAFGLVEHELVSPSRRRLD